MEKKKIFTVIIAIATIVSLILITIAVISIYKDFTSFSAPELYVSHSFVKNVEFTDTEAAVTYSLSFHNTDDDGIGNVNIAAYFGDNWVVSQETVDITSYEIVTDMECTFRVPKELYNGTDELPVFAVQSGDDFVEFTKVTGNILQP